MPFPTLAVTGVPEPVSGPTDWLITTSGNTMTIADVSNGGAGKSMDIRIEYESGSVYVFSPGNKIQTNSSEVWLNDNIMIPANFSGIANIVINANAGDDSIQIHDGWGDAANQKMVNLQVNGGTGDDNLGFYANTIFRPDFSLDADFTNDGGVSGNDYFEIKPGVTVSFSGATGSATVKTSTSISIDGTMTGGPGGITLIANEFLSGTGAVGGVVVAGTVQALGDGNITLNGTGATTGSVGLVGLLVEKDGRIISDTGDITLTGRGGSNAASGNRGIVIQGQVTSTGGDISLTGTGRGTGGNEHFGVYIERQAGSSNGIVSAGGLGNVTVLANGSSVGSNASGLALHGGSELKCTNGDLTINGTGGGSAAGLQNAGVQVTGGSKISGTGLGTVTVTGIAGNTTGDNNQGVLLAGNGSAITTNTGDLKITGTGNGSGNLGHGVQVSQSATLSSSGQVLVIGGSSSAPSSTNYGIFLVDSASIQGIGSNANLTVHGTGNGTGTSSPGLVLQNGSSVTSGNQALVEGTASTFTTLDFTGLALINAATGTIAASSMSAPSLTLRGTSGSSTGIDVDIGQGAQLASTGSAGTGINIEADRLAIREDASLNGNSLPVRLAPKTAGRIVVIDGADNGTQLGISISEINRCAGNPVIIGSATSGNLTVQFDPITITTASEVRLQSGASIQLNNTITHSSGTVSLFGGSTGIRPKVSGNEVTAANLVLAGKTRFEINGSTANTSFDQFGVAGAVQIIAGTTLELAGSHTPGAGETFVLINNDLTDNVTGTFNGLAEGASLTFNSTPMTISYVGGDGNDVVLTQGGGGPVNFPPKFTLGANQIIPNTTASQTVANWATNIDDGDSDYTQILTFNTSNNNNAIFSVSPSINSTTGTLTYTPSGIAGTATVTVTLTDDNTIAGQPPRSSSPVNFTITVNPAPIITGMLEAPLPSGGSDALAGTTFNGAADQTEAVYQSDAAGTNTYLEFDLGTPKAVTGFVNVTLSDPSTAINESRLIFDTDGTPGFDDSTDTVILFDAASTGSVGSGIVKRFPLVNAQFVRWEVVSASGTNPNLGTTEMAFLTTKEALIPINDISVIDASPESGVGYEPKNALNGVVGLNGIEDVGYASNNQGVATFVDFDLGRTQPVAGFDFFDRLNVAHQITSFDLIFSNSPDFSSPIKKSFSKTSPQWLVSDSFAAVNARYIRFDVTGAPSGQPSGIGEIIFYASAPTANNLGSMGTGNVTRDITFDYSGHSGEVIDVTAEFTLNPAHNTASAFFVTVIAPDGTEADFFRMHVIDNSNIAGPYLFNDGVPTSRSLPLAAVSIGDNDAPPAGSYHPYYGLVPGNFRGKFKGKSITGTWIIRFTNLIGAGGSVSSAKLTVVQNAVVRPLITASNILIAPTTTTLTINGSGFDPVAANNTVTFSPSGTGTVSASTETSLTITNITGLVLGPLNAVVTSNERDSLSTQVANVRLLPASSVAFSGTTAPGIPGATFNYFGDLSLNESGHTVLYGRVSGPGITTANDAGVWINDGSGFSLMLREGGSTGTSGRTIAEPIRFGRITDTGITHLMSGVAGAPTTANAAGWVDNGTSFTSFYRKGTIFTNAFNGVSQQVASPDGYFAAQLKLITGSITAANDTGIWKIASDGATTVATREGRLTAGSTTLRVGNLMNRVAVSSTGFGTYPAFLTAVAPTVLPSTQNRAILKQNFASAGEPVIVAQSHVTPVPGVSGARFNTFQSESINATGNVAFGALLTNGVAGVTTANDFGLWRQGISGLELAIREGQAVPNRPSLTFKTVITHWLLDDGSIVLHGTTNLNDQGLWHISASGIITQLLGLGQAIPQANNATFSAFYLRPDVSPSGKFAAAGTLTIGSAGTTASTNRLLLIGDVATPGVFSHAIRSGNTYSVNGTNRTVRNLHLGFTSGNEATTTGGTGGMSRCITSDGRAAIWLQFADGTFGHFVTDNGSPVVLPPPSS